MSAMPLPINMNAFIASHLFQAMMAYSMIQPSQPAPLSHINFFASHSLGNQCNAMVQTTQHTSVPIENFPKSKIEEEKTVTAYVIDPKPQHDPNVDHPELDEDEELIASEEELIEELRVKAMRLKKTLLRRFKREKKSIISAKHSSKGTKECTFSGCAFRTSKQFVLLRHVSSHYPDVYFCPICHSSFSRVDKFDKHFQTQSKQKDRHVPCVESEGAMRYEVARDKERFNVYYLGAMEDYPMPEEHFEALAGRMREEGFC